MHMADPALAVADRPFAANDAHFQHVGEHPSL